MSDDDEFDNLPDLFSGISETEWSRMLDQPTLASDQHSPRASSSTGSAQSTDYGDDSSLDENVLAEIDRIETHALQQTGGGPSSTTRGTAHHDTITSNVNGGEWDIPESPIDLVIIDSGSKHQIEASGRTEIDHESMQSHYFMNTNANPHALVTSQLTREGDAANAGHSTGEEQRSLIEETSCPPAKRPRTQLSHPFEHEIGSSETMLRFLEGYEEEMTCAICCDLFVGTHIGNPCGHSYCGDCGWQWVRKNNQCPICRAKLIKSQPLLPNIVMDSLVEKHIEQLISVGDEDWQPHGSKYKERAARKEKWKGSIDTRMKSKRTHKPVMTSDIPEILSDEVLFLPSDDDESYTENSPQGRLQTETTNSHSGRRRRSARRRRRN